MITRVIGVVELTEVLSKLHNKVNNDHSIYSDWIYSVYSHILSTVCQNSELVFEMHKVKRPLNTTLSSCTKFSVQSYLEHHITITPGLFNCFSASTAFALKIQSECYL